MSIAIGECSDKRRSNGWKTRCALVSWRRRSCCKKHENSAWDDWLFTVPSIFVFWALPVSTQWHIHSEFLSGNTNKKSLFKFYVLLRRKESRFPGKISEKRHEMPLEKVQIHRICPTRQSASFWQAVPFWIPQLKNLLNPQGFSHFLQSITRMLQNFELDWNRFFSLVDFIAERSLNARKNVSAALLNTAYRFQTNA